MLGDWIRSERERRGWSQSALARRAGITSQAINMLERGKSRSPNGTTVEGLAAAFGMTVADLYSAAYGDVPSTLTQLRSEGVPPAVLAELEDAASELSEAQWAILVAVARDMAGRSPERRQQRAQRTVRPAEPSEPPDERPGPDPPGRISATGRRWGRLEV